MFTENPSSYKSFLDQKDKISHSHGHECNVDISCAFDFQKDIIRWATKKGRAAIFVDCGGGKSICQLKWAESVCKKTNGNVLILAPLAVSKQTHREGIKFGVESTVCRTHDDVKPGINITNYEMLHHFDTKNFYGIVIDECFSPDTKIESISFNKKSHVFDFIEKDIKDISAGDIIINASGADIVDNKCKRKINRAVCISYNGRNITCSENHPFLTMHGWRPAKNLQPGDCLMATAEAMRLVREDFQPEVYSYENAEILRDILFSEMEDEHTRNKEEDSYERDSCENRTKKEHLVQIREYFCVDTDRKDKESESMLRSECEKEDVGYIESDRSQTFSAWGEWNRDDIASAIDEGCFARRMDSGVTYIVGSKKTRFSNMLQSRFGELRNENSDRIGRAYSQIEKGERREKGQHAKFFRVDSVEILEQGSDRLDKYREDDGFVYFYDIKAKRHPSFTVNGALVHNSSILKSYSGKIRSQVIDAFRDTPYRLSCTATPAPNDHVELGNQAEFLGVMTRSEMLATFFVHDGGETATWRLKKHAVMDFWRWMSSWAVMIKKPSDIGYSDDGFILPELNMKYHMVDFGNPLPGELFKRDAVTLDDQREARRSSIQQRIEIVKQLISEQPDEQWLIWSDLNVECDALKKHIAGVVDVRGSDSIEFKEKSMLGFSNDEVKILSSKTKIAGHGMNWQNCHNMIFFGLSNSYESLYQAVRRCWRFGQKHPVNVHIITSDIEQPVIDNIQRKHELAETMSVEMVKSMADFTSAEIKQTKKETSPYEANYKFKVPSWI